MYIYVCMCRRLGNQTQSFSNGAAGNGLSPFIFKSNLDPEPPRIQLQPQHRVLHAPRVLLLASLTLLRGCLLLSTSLSITCELYTKLWLSITYYVDGVSKQCDTAAIISILPSNPLPLNP